MKAKRLGITEILRRIWLLSANKIKVSESVSKQPTQLTVELISSLRQMIVTLHHLLLKHWVFLVKKRKKERKIIIKLSRFFIHTKGCKTKV